MASAVLLVAAAIGVTSLREGRGHHAVTVKGGGDPVGGRHSKSERGLRSESERAVVDLSSTEAVRRLHNLLAQQPLSSHRFETVERWVGHLGDADLQDLIGELGMEDYAGLTGWVRCALYAEWARRDPKAALARAEELPDPGDHRNYAVQQVLFSVLRGWAESDPKAALAERNRLVKRLGSASSALTNLIFRELARRDPEAEWRRFSNYSGPLKAFFMGLDGKESVVHYLDRWDRERWSSVEAHHRYAAYKARLAERRRSDSEWTNLTPVRPVRQPGDEHVAAGAALALAEYDVEGAVSWLSEHGPGDDADRRGRIYGMLSEWASAHPAEALRLIEEDRLESHTRSLAYAAIKGDPGIARAVMQAMDDHGESERAAALRDSMLELDSIHEADLFPAPGLPNRLPNFQERYECLLDAVEAGNFRADRKRSLLRSLYQEFRSKVPEAQQDYEAMRKLK